ncbi:hypothetical protein LPJ81_000676 [Coemansia sp. IMI 209127]|nr:hypothetical protein LPJ81_000676 [Coemansia sp. IMI 209127]
MDNSRLKRIQVKNACVNCQRACKKCNDERPCLRCSRYGLTESCVDSQRKPRQRGIKRGPYKKRAKQPTTTLMLDSAAGTAVTDENNRENSPLSMLSDVALTSRNSGIGASPKTPSMLSSRIDVFHSHIIGAGPAGLAVARVLASEPDLPFEVTVLERSNNIGGVWNYTPDSVCHYNVPQDSSKNALTRGYDERCKTTGGFPTPMYDDLCANLPKDVMQFPEFPFPEEAPDFPGRKQIQQYIHSYYDDPKHKLEGLVQLSSQVESAEYKYNEWICTVRRLTDDDNCTETLKVYVLDEHADYS